MDRTRLPPLSMLRAFEAAARAGGFTAAGRELNVTHAAVAQQVRGLEARLGVALMRREGRGLALTIEGRRLAEGLGEGLDAMRRAVEEIAAAGEAQPVRVTTTPKFSAYWLMPRIARFRVAHPEVELMFSPSAGLVDMTRGEFDLAIRFGIGEWPGAETSLLVPSAHVVVATPGLLDGRGIERPADLLRLPWVQETETQEWHSWLAAKGVSAAGKHDVIHLPGYMALQAIREGQGVGLTARVFVEADLAAGRLVALFDDAAQPAATGYHLVRRPGPMRPAVAAFARWLRREAEAE
ncbi:MAG: LysR substrate-binding domain-containing protein [Paracoccaceae bacterium]